MKRKIFTIIALALVSILIFSSSKLYLVKGESSEEISVKSKAHILADFATGEVISSRSETERVPIASMVKIMTLNLIFDELESGRLSETDMVTISENASSMGGSQAFLDPHCQYSVDDLIKSIIVASANDSCVAMAEHISGSVEAFVYKMNQKAVELSMNDTNFVNCTGLPAPNAYSSALDVMKMSRKLMEREKFFNYSTVWTYDLIHPSGRSTTLTNTNKLTRFYNGCDGGKTGYTNEAKSCLSATAKRGDTRLICVVVGAPSSKERNAEVSKLFDYGFANYHNQILVNKGVLPEKMHVTSGKASEISVAVEKDISIFSSKRDKNGEINISYCYTKNSAPIEKGEVVGKVEAILNGEVIGFSNIVANESVSEMNYVDFVKRMIKSW